MAGNDKIRASLVAMLFRGEPIYEALKGRMLEREAMAERALQFGSAAPVH